jgi:hypothetical protein
MKHEPTLSELRKNIVAALLLLAAVSIGALLLHSVL